MVDDFSKEIIDTIASMAKEGCLEVVRYSWPQKYKLDLYHCRVKLKYKGCTITADGSATDFNENKSLVRAFMEAIERDHFLKFNDGINTTNGLAVHFNQDDAIQNAIAEYIERDSFMSHYLTYTPFFSLDCLKVSSQAAPILDFFERSGLQLHVRELVRTSRFRSVIIFVENPSTQCALSMSMASSVNLDLAFDKALKEVLSHTIAYIEDPSLTLSKKSIDQWGPFEHGQQLLDADYWRDFKSTFLNEIQESNANVVDDSVLNAIQVESDLYPSKEFINLKVFWARAKSEQGQGFYFGPTLSDKVNLQRLSLFKKRQLLFSNLNLIPHPFA